jgi:hypothetical protein
MAEMAHRCLLAALDRSDAQRVTLVDGNGEPSSPVLDLPPLAMRLVAEWPRQSLRPTVHAASPGSAYFMTVV